MKPSWSESAPKKNAGISAIEVIVLLLILLVIVSLMLPSGGHTMKRGKMTQSLSNMKQLHLATTQMAMDGVTTGATNLGWPGDTGGTFSNWVNTLVPEYLTTNDMSKLLSAPGKKMNPDHLTSMDHSAVLVYAVTTHYLSNASPSNAVFLTSANFTNTPTGGLPLQRSAKPYGNKGFILFRKAGDGAILLSRQVGQTNVIGSYVPLCR